jgi:energy-coupling factor transport system substrate-specific component
VSFLDANWSCLVKERLLSLAVYGLSTALGVTAFLYPFFLPTVQKNATMGQAHAQGAPLVLTLLVGVCFLALLLEIQVQAAGAKLVALVGILVSINSILRFVEVAIPGPGGFSPIFFLIVLTGYVYGGRFGFLMGSLTLLVSALITGSLGPWLPYQMYTAGWVGLSAPICRPLVGLVGGRDKWREVVVLAVFGGMWGLVYGGIMNIWFWPSAVGPAEQHWQPGMGWSDTVSRYLVFYVITSLGWDMLRLAGNVALVLAFGRPTLRALRRFAQRFAFMYQPQVEVAA